MAQGAAHLVDEVFPQVPVRQWVLSMPMRVRLMLAWRPELVGRALAMVISVLERYYVGRTGGLSGSVTVVQRFGSSLNVNIHFHILALDGGFVEDGGAVRFVASRAPGRRVLASMVEAMGRRLDRLVATVDDELDEAGQLALWACQGVGGSGPRQERRFEASWGWYSLEASRRTAARDRDGLERMCRYVLRPAVSLSRLGTDAEGRVVLTLRHPWRDGTVALRFEREELVRRLAALVPPKGQHMVRYHGVLAPASSLRSRVVRRPRMTKRWMRWSALVERTFGVEAIRCPVCRERMRERALVRRGAREVWMWLEAHAERLLVGAPSRAGPAEEKRGGRREIACG